MRRLLALPVLAGLLASTPSLADDADPGPPRVTTPPSPSPSPVPSPSRSPVPSPSPSPVPSPSTVSVSAPASDTVGSETIEIVDRPPPGSQAAVDTAALERAEHDDIHKVLAAVAGVYLRDEDGYGLRPNIGMRGAAAERSAKVALMEDGVLIAPAPYSAPAAYYFPLVTRMSKIEVTKGPAAILYGPNTVGGAINLVSEPMPGERSAYLDAALGSDRYGKLHARAAERGERWGVMAEYVKLRTDGFKRIDGGGDSGFGKDDAQLSARLSSLPTARVYHQLDARVGYATERSNETYTGLTDADFAASPLRRYAATRDDQMNWTHWRFRLAHRLELGTWLRVETTAYRNDFHRVWAKVDGFYGQRDFAELIANPDAGANRIYYAVLTGAADSASPEEELIRGSNDRTFASEGVQSRAELRGAIGPTTHTVDAGVRVHFDRARRQRYEDGFRMMGGDLVASDRARQTALDTTAETLAIAAHAQDAVRWRRLEVVSGVRVEVLDGDFADHLGGATRSGVSTVVIPGGGAQVQLTDEASLLAGVHRGFVPVAPSAAADTRPELSVNYEAGARWRSDRLGADLIGFFSDYSNLKGSCTFSTGCAAQQEGDEYNGGRVHIWGVEAQADGELALTSALAARLHGAYTLTRSAFQSSFESEFAGWQDVRKGDELPYLPAHQIALGAAIGGARWELGSMLRWHGAVRDLPGQGAIAPGERGDALLAIDLSAHGRLAWGELYATCDNLLDEQVIVSRRPYGPRPSSPRLVVVGFKARL